ncbi:MAG: ribosome recycling factor [Cyanobacteria bacterium P01_G01_bin.54]
MKLSDLEASMQKAIEATQRNFNTVRTGRANASLLDRVEVDYYGSPTPLKSIAGISTPEATMILIQPYDASSMTAIERAISLSDIGITPNNDGKVIRLNIPPLTQDRRKELAKKVKQLAEDGKVSVRNIRRDAVESVRKEEKSSEISKDESADLQAEIQKITNKYTTKIDEILAAKEKDIMTI